MNMAVGDKMILAILPKSNQICSNLTIIVQISPQFRHNFAQM